ncbi:hypothetical protein NCC78_03095 [Micromonospora phytophila]|uniref:hypothetical protein n=1 Tax=Micromonospora phytophila TaxID=709888 RepID=UPI00202F46BC|nr:hypothetical protein [Micromonospora phytophila]MCM0673698.1 hypothetical protein [Micromonospora phytophila]
MFDGELAIQGYELPDGARLVDGKVLLQQPGFWPVYLAYMGGAVYDTSAAFDVPESARSDMERTLLDRAQWPVLSLRLTPAQGTWWRWLRIVNRNMPDDGGLDVLVTSDLGGSAVRIAGLGEFYGPGLCWEELRALADMPDPALSREQRLLLALPFVGDKVVPADARTVVAAALRSVGATGDVDTLVSDLVDPAEGWGAGMWVIRHGVRMCLARHALRHMQDTSLNELREVDLAFGARFARSRSGSREYRPRAAGRTMPRWRFEVVEARADGVGLRLLGRLDGEIRDGESARLVDGVAEVPIAAVRVGEDPATRNLFLTIDAEVPPPAPGAQLLPADG